MAAQDDSEYNDMELQELEELVYALQIDYDPPLTEDDRKRVVDEIIKLKDHGYEEEDVKEKWRSKRKGMGRSCFNEKTFIDVKDVNLVSDDQMVFMEDKNKSGSINYCFDRYSDVNHVLENNKNPFNKKPLNKKQISSLSDQYKNSKYPNIFVDEFPEEFDSRIKGKIETYVEPAYKKEARKLENIVKEAGEGYLMIEDFASIMTGKDYNLFLRHKGIEKKVPDVENRNKSALHALLYILNYIEKKSQNGNTEEQRTQNGNIAKIEISRAIKEFKTMKDRKYSYNELLENEGFQNGGVGVKELFWKPNFVNEEYYENGDIKIRYYVDEDGKKDGESITWYQIPIGQFVEGVNAKISSIRNYSHGVLEGYSEKRFNNDNNSLVVKENYINGKRHGEVISYYKNGNIKVISNYSNGVLNGEYKSWHLNKNPKIRANYSNGLLDGKYKIWYPTEDLIQMECNYVKGMKNGLFTEFVLDGNNSKVNQFNYFEDKLHGDSKIWNYNVDTHKKSLISHIRYKNGKIDGLSEEWSQISDKLISKIYYKDGDFNGSFQKWYEDGTPKSYYNFENGKEQVIGKKWFPSGNVSKILYYKNGLRQGDYRRYYENGNLKKEGRYLEGKKDGNFISYYENGNLKKEGRYSEGKKDGKFFIYYENDKLKNEFNYDKGNEKGIHIYYDIEEKIYRTINYKQSVETVDFEDYEKKKIKNISISDYAKNILYKVSFNKNESKKYEFRYNAYQLEENYPSIQTFIKEFLQYHEQVNNFCIKTYYNNEGIIINENVKIYGIHKYERLHVNYINVDVYVKKYLNMEVLFYENGKIKSQTIKDKKDRYEGLQLEYSENGDLEKDVYYENGLITEIPSVPTVYAGGIYNGSIRSYYNDDFVYSIIHYVNGSKHGPYRNWNTKGILTLDSYYKYDKLNGKYLKMYNDGSRKIIADYKNDFIDGEYKEFYNKDSGNGIKKEFYASDGNYIENSPIKYYHPNGTIGIEEYYKDDTIFKAIYYHENGNLFYEINHDSEGNIHGNVIINTLDGNILTIERFDHGKKSGKFTINYFSGNNEVICNYDQDKLEGEFVTYYENGNIEFKGFFIDDKIHGVVEIYSKSGELEYSAEYENGILKNVITGNPEGVDLDLYINYRFRPQFYTDLYKKKSENASSDYVKDDDEHEYDGQ